MAYSALTIDTNVAYGNGFDFEHGLMGQLSQFAHSTASLLVTDVVRQELLKRLREMTSSTRDKVENAVREGLERRLIPPGAAEAAKQLVAGLVDPENAAQTRLEEFLKATGAVVVPSDLASLKDVTRVYFESAPPFETTGAKKAEFPDAIALLCLEAWAKKHGQILAVSKDRGWKAFAAASNWIDVVDDLAEALSVFQEQAKAEAAATAVRSLLGRLQAGELPDLDRELRDRLQSRFEELDLQPSAHSYHHFDAELAGVTVNEWAWVARDDGTLEVTVVRLENETIVVTIPVRANVTVHASFSLEHWDSIDREYVSLGSQMEERELEIEAEALLTLIGPLEAADEIDIDDVELVDTPGEVDFGEIELDRGEAYYE